jgi:hypothetical protein
VKGRPSSFKKELIMKKGPCIIIYNQSNTERITSIDFGPVMEDESSQEREIWIWNKKNFSDAPAAVDVRIGASACNDCAHELIESGCIMLRSSGVLDPDNKGIIDDAESEFLPLGDNLLTLYHHIGDIPTNCARRLYLRVVLPEGASTQGAPILILQVGYQSQPVTWHYATE